MGQLAPGELPSPVPVEADDTVWGASNAPVTLVAFIDFQCAFCARAHGTIEALEQHYGADLRVVYKHLPLDFHEDALPAAVALQAVRELGGTAVAARYVDRLMAEQHDLSDDNLVELAVELGVSRAPLRARLPDPRLLAAVDHDMSLAAAHGINGTPSFLINGKLLVGAQPPAEFRKVIDGELQAVRQLAVSGVERREIYAQRVALNLKAGPTEDVDRTVYRVPVDGSPAIGPDDAVVTIVEFSEFQCPFCRRVRPTLDKLRERFPNDVRVVFKHLPLPFHEHALPAARVSAEVFRTRGNVAFWEAAHELFEGDLGDTQLIGAAARAGLPEAQARLALTGEAGQALVDADLNLAEDLQVRGTPHFFINGRRLAGARPYEEFEGMVLAAISEARQALESPAAASVTPASYYAHLMQNADPLAGPKQLNDPVPEAGRPSWGPERAPVVLHAFSDFECTFCARVEPTLAELLRLYPKELKIVWHNLPLPFHQNARAAAAAALEAHAQRGNAGFHKMHDLLFASHASQAGPALGADDLRRYATQLGLDLARFDEALARGRHDAAIDADIASANALGIDGTPGFVVGSWLTTGARPLRYLRALVDRSLAESRAARPKK
ncbi:MAG TPA: thioredoxin domain-containing protein [Polyangiaceae bacterium]|nr:thioredoxin domain-containing protein [Polyangiaceae bacterium]